MRLLIAATLFAVPAFAQTFSEEETAALKACHDHVWLESGDFDEMPNAAVSVFPGSFGEEEALIFWNVYWDEPRVRAARNCIVRDGKVAVYENYVE